jgi:hypothetical protein
MPKKRRKTKRKGGNTAKASGRIFYRKPSLMLSDFLWSGTGLSFVPLAFLAGTLFIFHMSFIRLCT